MYIDLFCKIFILCFFMVLNCGFVQEAIVNAIFFTTSANPDLEQLVYDTNGIWFFGGDQNIQSILGAFKNLATKDDGDVYSETFQVANSVFCFRT